jgi:hypothetical protein
MLKDLEQEVINISKALSHAGYPFDLVVDTFGNSRCDFADEVVEDEAAFLKK